MISEPFISQNSDFPYHERSVIEATVTGAQTFESHDQWRLTHGRVH